MAIDGSANGIRAAGRDGALPAGLIDCRDADDFERFWDERGEEAKDELRELIAAAAKAGRVDLIELMVRKVGGFDQLFSLIPGLLGSLEDDSESEALEGLLSLGPFRAFRRRKPREMPRHWELAMVALAVRMDAVAALDEAVSRQWVDAEIFSQAAFSHARTLAFEARSAEMVDFLAMQGADLSARDSSGASPLAVALGRLFGASVDGQPKEREAAKRLATLSRWDARMSSDLLQGALAHTAILEAGLAAGANPEAKLPDGKRALLAAVDQGHDDSALVLAKRGANPWATGSDGRCAEEAAHAANRPGLAKMLTEEWGRRVEAQAQKAVQAEIQSRPDRLTQKAR
jgi:hypothetical protein